MRRSFLISMTLFLLLAGAGRNVLHDRSIFAEVHAQDLADGAVDAPPTTHALFTKLLQTVGISNPSGEVTPQDIFGETPKNLYLFIYQEIFSKPNEESLMELAAAYGFTPTDAQALINGSIAPLMRGRRNYSEEQAFADSQKIQKSYMAILSRNRLKHEMSTTIIPTEIFANGNLDDSGFDLIHDLDLIEQVLFVNTSKTLLNQFPIGAKPPSSTGKSGAGGAADTGSLNSTYGDSNAGANGGNGSGTTSSGMVSLGSSPVNSTSTSTAGKSYSIDDILGNKPASGSQLNYCASGSPLQKALVAYDKTNPPSNSNANSNSGSGSNIGNGNTGGSGNSASGASGIVAVPDITAITAPELLEKTTSGKKPFSPPVESFCNANGGTLLYTYRTRMNGETKELFCLSIEKKMISYASFYPGKSCIQCTVAAMNESMKKLLSKNISPNKLTGNTFESAKCKSAINFSDMLNINIVMIPTPVITPSKYGALAGNDIVKQWNNIAKTNTLFGDPVVSDPDLAQQEAAQNLNAGNTPVSQEELLRESQLSTAAAQKKFVAANAARPGEEAGGSKSAAYQSMIKEMRQMTAFFEAFKRTLEDINVNVKAICGKKDVNS